MEVVREVRTKGGFIVGVLFFILVLLGSYRMVLTTQHWLTDATRLPISELQLQGQYQYVDIEELRQTVLSSSDDHNFFHMNVNALQSKLSALPWVEQVSIRKKWPSELKVYLKEQPVAARWAGDRFINTRGELFSAPDRVNIPLLTLSGPDDQAKMVLNKSLYYESLLTKSGHRLLGVELTPHHAWVLTLDGNVKLFLGRSDTINRLQRFIDFFPEIEPREQIAYVDLRYDTGMAVGWIESKEKRA